MTDKHNSEKFQGSGDIVKRDNEKRIMGGWFNVFKYDGEDVVDRQGDVVDIESYSDAYVEYVKDARVGKFDHDGNQRADLIDSILIDSEEYAKMLVSEITGMSPEDIPVKKIGHFGSFQVRSDEDWELAKNDKLMFSIGGTGKREEIND
ncbi:MAG: hypothetical protein CML17_01995 [Pusillimonas sp.]|jgi:hypothetical protein|nr:hypothetical protein [Pusillimonas sp.]|tara:strand:+ start:125 stop:571 length:447 start_codon:yes stop_codon:yes gene_type:complete